MLAIPQDGAGSYHHATSRCSRGCSTSRSDRTSSSAGSSEYLRRSGSLPPSSHSLSSVPVYVSLLLPYLQPPSSHPYLPYHPPSPSRSIFPRGYPCSQPTRVPRHPQTWLRRHRRPCR